MNRKVYIVLLNYNSSGHTIECLKSIQKSTYDNVCTIIVDNKSQDESVINIETYFKQNNLSYVIEEQSSNYKENILSVDNVIIKSNFNGGFASGNNIALRYILKNSNDGYVWVLNNDTYIDCRCIENLISETGDNILMGSVLVNYYDRKTIQTLGGFKLNNYLGIPRKYCKGKTIDEVISHKYDLNLDMISGASIFMSINTLKKIGLMPEEYFMYWEDTDWCRNAKNRGLSLDYCNKAIVYHKEGGSIGNRSYNQVKLDFRNTLYFYHKNNSKKYIKFIIINKILINTLASIKNKSKVIDTLKGSFEGIREFKSRINKEDV